MRVWIQKFKNEFPNCHYYTAWKGFTRLGCNVTCFEPEEINSINITKMDVIFASIPVSLQALRILDVEYTPLESIPTELAGFAGRRIWSQTMTAVRVSIGKGEGPVFIKPLATDSKLFKGCVLRYFKDLACTASLPAETVVSCSEYVEFLAEYRTFCHRKTIVGCKHYKGDFRLAPDFRTLDSAIVAYDTAPIAYGMDFGITTDNRCLLVEVNDAYCLGCYGLEPVTYANLIADRWHQIAGG